MMKDSNMLTGAPSLSKLSKKYFTDSPCEDDKEKRESVTLSKHCKLTIKTAEHKLDIQTYSSEDYQSYFLHT